MRVVSVMLGIFVAAGLVVGGAGLAGAAADKPAAKAEEKAPAAKGGRHVGKVKAVDAAGNSLTVEEAGKDEPVSVTEKTQIKRGKDTIKLSDLKAGDEVTVRYTTPDGKAVAISIAAKEK